MKTQLDYGWVFYYNISYFCLEDCKLTLFVLKYYYLQRALLTRGCSSHGERHRYTRKNNLRYTNGIA